MIFKKSQYKYPDVYVSDVIRFIWEGIQKNKFWMFLTIFTTIVASSFKIFAPIYYKNFFDILSTTEGRAQDISSLVSIIFYVLALNLFAWIFWRIGSFANVRFQAASMMSLRQQAFEKLIHHSYSFFSSNFTGALVQRIGRYARAFERITDRLIWNIIPLTVRISGIIIVTLFIDKRLTLVIVVWAILYMLVSYFYSRWRLKYNIEMAEADSHTTAVLADSIVNQNNIEVFNRYSDEIDNIKDATEHQKKITQKNWEVNSWLDGIQAFFALSIEFIVFYFAIMLWKDNFLTVGTFVLIQIYIVEMSVQLWDFAKIIRDFYEGYADTKEMVEIMKLPYEIKNLPSAKPIKMTRGEIVLRNVNYSFNKTREVLKDINLVIAPGEKIALVGPSGAGKTTLARLLLRFYDTTSGEILVDNQDIKYATLESLRNNISLVPQDPLLFHRTIMENIRYGRPGASDEEVIHAAKLAHCDDFVQGLAQKYNTYVGERGIKLSGGERQRVAIARAILKDAPILILDEATSSLDSHSEALIQEALDVLIKNKTTIVIAHRLSTIKKMDRVIVIEGGEIVETGTHSELISKRRSLYKKLWTLQVGGFIK